MTCKATNPIHIVGGGLAGSEAAWQAAQMGVPAVIHEMRPFRGTDAHKTDGLAETGVFPIPSGRMMRRTTRSGCCTRKCAAAAR